MEVLWKSTRLSSISRSSFKVHLGKPNQWLSRQIRSLAMGFWTNAPVIRMIMESTFTAGGGWTSHFKKYVCPKGLFPQFLGLNIYRKCLKSTPPRNTLRFRCWWQDVNWIYCLWFMDNKNLHHLGCTVLTRSTNQRDKQPIPTGDRTYNGFLFGSCLGDKCLKFLPTSGQHEASCTHSCASWDFSEHVILNLHLKFRDTCTNGAKLAQKKIWNLICFTKNGTYLLFIGTQLVVQIFSHL